MLVELELENVGFCGGRKAREPGGKPSEQGEDQQQTQPTFDTWPEWNPGHNGGRQVVSPLHHLYSHSSGNDYRTASRPPPFTFLHFLVVKVCDLRTCIRGNNTFLDITLPVSLILVPAGNTLVS